MGRSIFLRLAKQHIARQVLGASSAHRLDIYLLEFGGVFLESMEEDRPSIQSKFSVKLIPISYEIAIDGHSLLSLFF